MTFETLESKTIYQGRVFRLRQDHVRLPNGVVSKLDIVEHNSAVVVVPLDDSDNFRMVRQYRHAAQAELLEFPAGTLEPGEDPASCARRELQEETGMAAGVLEQVGGFFLAPGYSSEYIYIFIARDLYVSKLAGDEDEWLSPVRVSLAEFPLLAHNRKIEDAKSLAAFMLARPSLQPG
jgi:ADP-ribose pyrophosphatase